MKSINHNFFNLVFWNKRGIAYSKVKDKLERRWEEKGKFVELSWSKLTQLSCNSDSSRVVSVWNCVLLRVRLNCPRPESQLLETGDLRRADCTCLRVFCLSNGDVVVPVEYDWLDKYNRTVVVGKDFYFFLYINLITGLGSSELNLNYCTSESWLLWALVFSRQPGLEHLLAALFIQSTREIIEMPDKQENGGHTSQLSFTVSDTASPFGSKLHTGHVNLLQSSYYNILL